MPWVAVRSGSNGLPIAITMSPTRTLRESANWSGLTPFGIAFFGYASGIFHAVRWNRAGRVLDLGTLPGGVTSDAIRISDNGMIVGNAHTASGERHATLWDRNGNITDLGTLPGGTDSYASDVNSHGAVVGASLAADGALHAVIWQASGI